MRLCALPTRRQDVDDEFQFHLDMRVSELVKLGMTGEDARREALRQFGDLDDARRACRAEDIRRMREYRLTFWLENVRQDFILALRTLRRQPAFAVSTVLTLGIAIGIATTAYGLVHAYLVRPLPYPEPQRLVYVIAGPSREPLPNAPSLATVDWTTIDSVFAETVAWDLDGYTLAGGEQPEYVDGAWVSPGYFRALGMQPRVGRGFTPEEYAPGSQVAIISDALWSRRFRRDKSVIGQSIRAHSTDRPRDNELVTIVGVMAPEAWHISRFTDVLRPLSTPRIASMALLKPGMSRSDAEARLNERIRPQVGQADANWRMTLVSVQDEYTFQIRPTLMAMLGAAVFLLLIGAASVAGAQTARAAARRSEIQLRFAIGGSWRRIMLQLLTESLVVALVATVVGVTLAMIVLSGVGDVIARHLGTSVPGGSEQLPLGTGLLAISTAVGILVGTAFGLLPALTMLRSAGGNVGERGIARSQASPALRRVLLVTQVALTMMLLVGAGLMTRTMLAIGAEPLGFETARIVKANLLLPQGRYPDPTSRRTGIGRLLVRLQATPGIDDAAVVSPHPFRGVGQAIAITPEGRNAPPDQGPRAVQFVVTDRYFDVMQIPLRRGRAFGPADDWVSTPAVIISEALARELWPAGDAIGRRIRIGSDTILRSIVGVVGDTRKPLESEQKPDVYLPYSQVPRAYVSIVARVTHDPARARDVIQRSAAEVDDVFALADVEPLTDVVARDHRRQGSLAAVLSLFGVFALFVAMMGLFASLSYLVSQRTREIAIRVAVGAQPRSVSALVLREGVLLVGLGVIGGGLLSIAVTRMLSTQLYGVGATDPVTFAVIAGLLALTALAAAASPILRAVRLQPAIVLRSD